MGYTNFPNGITSMGVPAVGSVPLASTGKYWFVNADTTIASDGNSGTSLTSPLLTVQRAVNLASPGDVILIAPGAYDESVTIARTGGITGTLNNLVLYGYGGRGAAFIAPTTTNAVAVTNHADDVTIINVGLDGDGTGAGLHARRRR
jgi:hypothetical protein